MIKSCIIATSINCTSDLYIDKYTDILMAFYFGIIEKYYSWKTCLFLLIKIFWEGYIIGLRFFFFFFYWTIANFEKMKFINISRTFTENKLNVLCWLLFNFLLLFYFFPILYIISILTLFLHSITKLNFYAISGNVYK